MKVYVEAYNAQGRQILGNMDGQGVIRAKNYRRTEHYRMLRSGAMPRLDGKVHHYRIVDELDRVLEDNIVPVMSYADHRRSVAND